MTNISLCSFAIAGILFTFTSCNSFVHYEDAQRAASSYQSEIHSLDALSQNYGELVESKAAREAWKADATASPGLDRLAAVWAFRESEDIDTGRPVTNKAVVIPGVLWSTPQKRQEIDGMAWGVDKRYTSVKKQGDGGYIIAFFR